MSVSPFPETKHDHADCVRQGLAQAEDLCRAKGVRLTDLRRTVLELLLQQHRALGAYDILERIDWGDKRPAPPIVYRALDFLLEQGLAHRIESRKAFFACPNPGSRHGTQFLICDNCARVAELTDTRLSKAVAQAAKEADFELKGSVIEMVGLCSECRSAS